MAAAVRPRPRFAAGQDIVIDGMCWRIDHGKDFPGDLVLLAWDGDGRRWVWTRFAIIGLYWDFYVDNEMRKRAHRNGWQHDADAFLSQYLHATTVIGWQAAYEQMGGRKAKAG